MNEIAPSPAAPRTVDTFAPQELFDTWQIWKQRTAQAQVAERVLRDEIVRRFFPNPKEGSNNVDIDLAEGAMKINLTHGVDRKVDGPLFENLRDDVSRQNDLDDAAGIPRTHPLAGVNFDSVTRKRIELATTNYKALDSAIKPFFDVCLVIKDSSPQVKLLPRKK